MNYEKVAAVLSQEKAGLCNGELILQNGEKVEFLGCAVGALLFHAGFTNDQIAALDISLDIPQVLIGEDTGNWWDNEYGDDEASLEFAAREKLKEVYDMNEEDIESLMAINDYRANVYYGGDPETNLERRDRVVNAVLNNLRMEDY